MQTALVTGGSRGIGAATVRELSKRGWRTAFTYLHSENAAKALAGETGALAIPCDARDEAQTRQMAQTLLREFHRLDALVCNAGTS